MGKVVWNGEAALAQLRAEVRRRIIASCIVVANRAKALLSVSGTGPPGRDKQGRFIKQYGADASKPGEPPRKQTGHLRRSVAYEVDGPAGRVGTNLLYGRWLELGTRLMAARPWLRRALMESQDQIKAIWSRPMKFR